MLCSVSGCDQPIKVRSVMLCNSHYLKNLRHGTPKGKGRSYVQHGMHKHYLYTTYRMMISRCTKAQKKMVKYCEQDVKLTKDLYLWERPWITNHPSIGVLEDRPKACDNCGSTRLHNHTKKTISKTGWKMQYKCYDCGAYKIGSKLNKFDEKLI